MASLVKRGDTYAVVYYYSDVSGKRKQKWESYKSEQQAMRRKAEVEHKQLLGDFVAPNQITLAEFLIDFLEKYGTVKWCESTYSNNVGLINNYIKLILGDVKIQKISPVMADAFIRKLMVTRPVERNGRRAKTEHLTASAVNKIVKLLKTACKQAVRYKIIETNPFDGAILPKQDKTQRVIWSEEQIAEILAACDDDRLLIVLHLAFACAMRINEICGLTWGNVHIGDEDIRNGGAYLVVDRGQKRANKKALEATHRDHVLLEFPSCKSDSNTCLIHKPPKTDAGNRKIWIPDYVAKLLRQWQIRQMDIKRVLGSEYQDYGLVVAQDNGRPWEDASVRKAFYSLQERMDLPHVTFHSLRHSSTTYKLLYSHGDIKSVQGDTGHSRAEMVVDLYAHAMDSQRRKNAQHFQEAFYDKFSAGRKNNEEKEQSPIDMAAVVKVLQEDPEMLRQFLRLLTAGNDK